MPADEASGVVGAGRRAQRLGDGDDEGGEGLWNQGHAVRGRSTETGCGVGDEQRAEMVQY